MRSTGIEPVSHPWKGGILPLNHERFILFVDCFFAYYTRVSIEIVQLSPLVIPSHVNPAAIARVHNSFFRASGSLEAVCNEKKSELPGWYFLRAPFLETPIKSIHVFAFESYIK